MELRQLEYFQMASRLQNITRAAEHLHVSQSTISMAIHKLEEELKIQLFDRSQKQLLLTPEGKAFLLRIDDILNRLQDTISEIDNYRQLQKGTLNVGVPPMIGSFLFPEILAGFKNLYPHIQLTTTEEGSFTICQQLERGELDIGIVNLCQPSLLLETLLVTTEQLVVCLPLNHPLAGNDTLEIKQLRNEPFILFKEGAYNRRVILEECKQHGFTPNIILSSDQVDTIKGLVAKGVGISFLIQGIARRSQSFTSIPLKEPLPINFGLAWKKGKYLSRAAQAFIKFITELKLLP